MRILILLLALLIRFASPVHAADDVADAQSIIRSQEEALSRDDAAKAYSFAAPTIQGLFGDADTFMSMVRNRYAPVYWHKSFDFGTANAVDGTIAQIVLITDLEGMSWQALYTLQRQSDGSWKIAGCVLSKLTDA